MREGVIDAPRWVLVYRSATLSPPSVALPLPAAAPRVTADRVALDYRSANGGRSVMLDARAAGPSTLDVFVNFELEVNVERDLDRAVDTMNTEAPIDACAFGPPAGPPRGDEWQVGAGYAWSVDLFQSDRGPPLRPVTTVSWGRDLTRDAGPGVPARPADVGGRGHAALLAGPADDHARCRHLATRLALALRAAPPRRGVRGAGVRRPLHTRPGARGDRRRPTSSRTAPSASVGVPAARVAWSTAYRFQHISNGNQPTTNPGVNAHVIWVGVAFSP